MHHYTSKKMANTSKQLEFERQLDLSMVRQFKKSGNIDFLKQVYEKYAPLVYGVAYRETRDRLYSQKAIIAVFEHLTVELIKSEVDNVREWIFRKVKTYCKQA